jgi:uncharacterized protein
MSSTPTASRGLPVAFDVLGTRLRGTLDLPGSDRPRRSVGVLMLNSDDGCRLGPHRLWVHLGAALGERGFACLRFDYRGCGDSEGPDESPTADVGLSDALAAESVLRDRAGVRAVVLVGICYGAEVALLAGECLDSVIGVVACSTGRYVTGAGYKASLADAFRYVTGYGRKLLSPETWRRILTGRVHASVVLGGLWRRLTRGIAGETGRGRRPRRFA